MFSSFFLRSLKNVLRKYSKKPITIFENVGEKHIKTKLKKKIKGSHSEKSLEKSTIFCLKQSFIKIFRHINIFFKGKHFVENFAKLAKTFDQEVLAFLVFVEYFQYWSTCHCQYIFKKIYNYWSEIIANLSPIFGIAQLDCSFFVGRYTSHKNI